MKLRSWLKFERLIPSATILLAFVAQALDLLNIIQLSLGEQLILLLIGLLGVDALTERLSMLEKIRDEIKALDGNSPVRASKFFQPRDKIAPLQDRISDVQSIDICGISLLAISTQHYNLLLKVRKGCKIRLLLLNPNNDALIEILAGFASKPEIIQQEIRTSLSNFFIDQNFTNSKFVEIRVSDYIIPHTMLITDADKSKGKMRVEMYAGKWASSRPGFDVCKSEDPAWFNLFLTQFNELWSKAKPYSARNSIEQ
ncbi:MAG: hypothetical protein HS114_01445 [Anaerolineales bacterium]|nr:hypothetical protein [Anaerolineales bacterium]